jgi:hypothetical protein
MASFANQKCIFIGEKYRPQKGEKNFFYVDNHILLQAFKNLNYSAFKLWCFFYSKPEGYTSDLECEKICKTINISRPQFYSSLKLLLEKGYLTSSENGLFYYFYANPILLAEEQKFGGIYCYAIMNKFMPEKEPKNFTIINNDFLFELLIAFTKTQFGLWLYFYIQPDEYTLWLSKKTVCELLKIGERQFHEGINYLIDYGYLTPTTSNHYTFNAKPLGGM